MFRIAYYKVTNIEKEINSFSFTGIYPYNSDIFGDEDFASSAVSDRTNEENEKFLEKENEPLVNTAEKEVPVGTPTKDLTEAFSDMPTCGASSSNKKIITEIIDQTVSVPATIEIIEKPVTVNMDQVNTMDIKTILLVNDDKNKNVISDKDIVSGSADSHSFSVSRSPYQIKPLPKLEFTGTRKRKAQKSEIITSRPIKKVFMKQWQIKM